ERAEIADSFVDPETAGLFLQDLYDTHESDVLAQALAAVQLAWFHGRVGHVTDARTCLAQLEAFVPTSYIGQKTFEGLTNAYIAVVSRSVDAHAAALDVGRRAKKQGAIRWARVAELLADANGSPEEF